MAAAAAMIADAIKASGVCVRMEPEPFLDLLDKHVQDAEAGRADPPLLVHSFGGVFRKSHKYLFAYRGLAFHTKSKEDLALPQLVEVIEAKAVSVPEL